MDAPAKLALLKAISEAGSITELARRVNVSPQVVINWRARGMVPAERCREVEAAVHAAVTRYDLRPDVFGSNKREAA